MPPTTVVFLVYAAVFGLIVGSYLNVVIYRLPRGLSTVLPRSRCAVCASPIGARDNLPVISFLLLRGRCRRCGAPISWRYPLIELATAALFVAVYFRFGPTLEALAALLFGALMLVLAAIDLEHYLLPDRLTLPGIVVGLALQPWLPRGLDGLYDALLGAALGGGALLAVRALWFLVRREEAMGLGDVKMLAMVGAFLGWKGVAVTFVVGVVAGAAVGLALLAVGRGGPRTRLPFGVFLAGGGLVALFWGPALSGAYLRLSEADVTAPRRRLSLRGEALALLAGALVLLVLVSTFTLISYRGALDLLAEERRDEAARLAAEIAAALPAGRLPGAEELRRLAPRADRVAIVDQRGSALVAAGGADGEPAAGSLLAPLGEDGARPSTGPSGSAPAARCRAPSPASLRSAAPASGATSGWTSPPGRWPPSSAPCARCRFWC